MVFKVVNQETKKDVRVFKVVNPEKEKDMLSFLSVGIVFDKLRINLI